jgi:hypothetical protein
MHVAGLREVRKYCRGGILDESMVLNAASEYHQVQVEEESGKQVLKLGYRVAQIDFVERFDIFMLLRRMDKLWIVRR